MKNDFFLYDLTLNNYTLGTYCTFPGTILLYMKLETSKHHNVDEAIMCPVSRLLDIKEGKKKKKKKLFFLVMLSRTPDISE